MLKFVNDLHVVKDNLFDLPPLFEMIRESAGTEWEEMYEVFNMGHRFEIYVKPEISEAIMGISRELGVDARVVGHVESYTGRKLTIKSPYGDFNY